MWNYWHFIFVAAFVNVALRDALGATTALIIALIVSMIGAAMTLLSWQTGLPPSSRNSLACPVFLCPIWKPLPGLQLVMQATGFGPHPGVKNTGILIPRPLRNVLVFLVRPWLWVPCLVSSLLYLLTVPALATDFGGNLAKILNTSISLGAVMMVLPRMVGILMEGLLPLSEGARTFLAARFPGRKLHIGLDAAVAIGHPANVATGLISVPIAMLLAILLNAIGVNRMLPFTDLAILPFYAIWAVGWSKGNIFRGVINMMVFMTGMFIIATQLAPYLTQMGKDVGFTMPEGALLISSIDVGAHLNGYLLALPFIKFLEGGLLALGITAGRCDCYLCRSSLHDQEIGRSCDRCRYRR